MRHWDPDVTEDKVPERKGGKVPAGGDKSGSVSAFLDKVARTPGPSKAGARGRLIFAMDATASREPSWDQAARIQGEMFEAARSLGGLELQLAFYRGFGEFKASKWVTNAAALTRLMTSVFCLAGETQIGKVLQHAINETQEKPIGAVIFVGDAMEEDVDKLGRLAGELGVLGVPVFLFHEGEDPIAAFAFQQIARLSGGACVSFDAASADVLRDLLSAVAVFVAGGRPALEDLAKTKGGPVLQLTHQMKR